MFQDNWRHDNVIAANSSKTFVFDVWYDVPTDTTVVPSDLKLSFGVDATPIIAAAPVAPIVVNLDGEAASHVGKTVELPNQFLTDTPIPAGTYRSTQVEVTINNTSAVDKNVGVMFADQQTTAARSGSSAVCSRTTGATTTSSRRTRPRRSCSTCGTTFPAAPQLSQATEAELRCRRDPDHCRSTCGSDRGQLGR